MTKGRDRAGNGVADPQMAALRPDPQPVSWTFVGGLILVGLGICVALGGTAAHIAPKPRRRLQSAVDPELVSAALLAYQRQDWDEAEKRFLLIHDRYPDNARAADFIDRIELTRRDAERLAQAEVALVAGRLQEAERLAARVAPNSALFAQAETLVRNARKPAEGGTVARPSGEGTNPAAFGFDVRTALGEALALYDRAKFDAAAGRADELAYQAEPAVRQELMRWAGEVRAFAQLFAALPADEAGLTAKAGAVRQAIEMDDRLGEGHYARGLRLRLSDAIMARTEVLLEGGAIFEACVLLREAKDLRGNERRAAYMGHRCDAEAARRLAQARGLERHNPDQARTLYEQAFSLATQGSGTARAAEQALADKRLPRH